MAEDGKLAVHDLLGLKEVAKAGGKVAIRLIDALNEQFSEWRRPARIVSAAEAEAEARLVRAEGALQARDRALAWNDAQEIRRQTNREAVVRDALEQAGEVPDEQTTNGRIDPDWLARFFVAAEDVSDETMQSLWAQILTGEATAPGSYSIRTLETVRLMSKGDAVLFENICSCSVRWNDATGWPMLLVGVGLDKRIPAFLRERSLDPGVASSLGFVLSESATHKGSIEFGGRILKFNHPDGGHEGGWFLDHFRFHRFSSTAAELARICGATKEPSFLDLIAEVAKTAGYEVAESKQPSPED